MEIRMNAIFQPPKSKINNEIKIIRYLQIFFNRKLIKDGETKLLLFKNDKNNKCIYFFSRY